MNQSISKWKRKSTWLPKVAQRVIGICFLGQPRKTLDYFYSTFPSHSYFCFSHSCLISVVHKLKCLYAVSVLIGDSTNSSKTTAEYIIMLINNLTKNHTCTNKLHLKGDLETNLVFKENQLQRGRAEQFMMGFPPVGCERTKKNYEEKMSCTVEKSKPKNWSSVAMVVRAIRTHF